MVRKPISPRKVPAFPPWSEKGNRSEISYLNRVRNKSDRGEEEGSAQTRTLEKAYQGHT